MVAFGYAISWGFASLGLRLSDPEAAQAAAVPVVFLLVFTSAAFVLAAAMPGWLQAFGTHQPVDAVVNAERALILGGARQHMTSSSRWRGAAACWSCSPSSPPAPTPAWAANRREPAMAVELNHTIVPAHDPQASAQFLADILGLPSTRRWRTSPL